VATLVGEKRIAIAQDEFALTETDEHPLLVIVKRELNPESEISLIAAVDVEALAMVSVSVLFPPTAVFPEGELSVAVTVAVPVVFVVEMTTGDGAEPLPFELHPAPPIKRIAPETQRIREKNKFFDRAMFWNIRTSNPRLLRPHGRE